MLLDAVSAVEAVRNRDFDEARFRCRQISDQAWSANEAGLANAAMNLEVALRDVDKIPPGAFEALLAFLLSELDEALRPLREG